VPLVDLYPSQTEICPVPDDDEIDVVNPLGAVRVPQPLPGSEAPPTKNSPELIVMPGLAIKFQLLDDANDCVADPPRGVPDTSTPASS
jgi:hypothetical protein